MPATYLLHGARLQHTPHYGSHTRSTRTRHPCHVSFPANLRIMVGPIRTIPGKEQTQRHQLGEKQTQFSLFWRGTATSQEWWRASSKWRIGSIRNSSIHMCSSTKKISLKILKSAPRLHTRCSDSQHDIITRRWTTEVTSTNCSYGKIPHDHWFQPDWIDETKATASRLDMIENNVCRRFLPNFSVHAHTISTSYFGQIIYGDS